MALKATLTKEEHGALAEGLRAAYKQDPKDEGKFVLDVEGGGGDSGGKDLEDMKKRLEEFRATNIERAKKAEELEAAVKKLTDEKQAAEDAAKKAADEKKTDTERMTEQIKGLREDFEKAQKAGEQARADAARERMTGQIREAAVKAGVRPAALPDVLARATVYGFEPGEDGKPKHAKAKTLDDFFTQVKTDAPFLYETTNGDGGGKGEPGGGGKPSGKVVAESFEQANDPAWQAEHRKEILEKGLEIKST